ncbi:MAG: hypothetical protein KDH17_02170 [Rhodocyclaceae bacterium]|nr:hypothetical protein [Rhodocyclaceae bacterium]
MGIQQLQIAYDALADRLLLRLCTTAGEEYLAHLTRRFVAQIWPGLAASLAASPPAPQAASGDSRGGRFDRPYEAPADVEHPLGPVPLLVAEARMERDDRGRLQLQLKERRQRAFSLTLNPSLLRVFCAMLRAGVGAADWGLALSEDVNADAGSDPAQPPTTLH